MFLWNMDKVVSELKMEQMPWWKSTLFILLTPIIHLSNLILFGSLMLGHQLLEYSFKKHLTMPHDYTEFYNTWASTISLATIFITLIGIVTCYLINKKGDNKNFLQRLSILGFSINFHITVYALITVGIFGILGYIGVMKHIALFKESIWPTAAAIKQATTQRSLVSSMFRTAGSLVFLPLLPSKVKLFIMNLRDMLLWAYPVISLFPPLLTILHYRLVAKFIRRASTPDVECPLPDIEEGPSDRCPIE